MKAYYSIMRGTEAGMRHGPGWFAAEEGEIAFLSIIVILQIILMIMRYRYYEAPHPKLE